MIRNIIGQPRPHVVQKQVGKRPDQLEGLFRLILQAVGDIFRHMAALAIQAVEQCFADVAPGNAAW